MAKSSGSTKGSTGLSFVTLMNKKDWQPLPAFCVLTGDANFFKDAIEKRFVQELFPDPESKSILKIDAKKNTEGLLAKVLDELRTLSILSPNRLVIIDNADSFLSSHRDDFEPYVREGFSGGHLILKLDKALDSRTKFGKAIKEAGWPVECKQPFDRPPPWMTGTPLWKNDLTDWLVGWAKTKKLKIDPQTAFHLQERVGNDLSQLDKSLEKIKTFLGDTRDVDERAVDQVTADIREDSVFDLVEKFILGQRTKALSIFERLMQNGYTPQKGQPIHDPMAISLLFLGSLIPKLRNLRRAHALKSEGQGPQSWIEERLTPKFLLERFQRELQAMPPKRLHNLFPTLRELDRKLKTGANPKEALTLLLIRH